MKSIIPALLTALLPFFFIGTGQAQITVFSENIGNPSTTTTIASHTFQNTGSLAFSGSADVRNTSPSSGYTGASGGGNVFVTNTVGRNFVISGINTTGFSGLTLSFGHHKSTTTGNNELAVEVSTDGTNYSALTYSRPTGTGTISWVLITPSGSIPATANLRIRFRQTGTGTQFRVDDIQLTGITSCTPAAAPTTPASNFSATTFCTSAQIAFTGGNGAKRIAVVSTANFSDTPANGTAYTANPLFGSGSAVGSGNFVVLNGTAANVTISGLVSGTTYYISVFEYNGATANCDESYLTAGVSGYSFTTQSNCATPQIRSVLVDACSSAEGLDELVVIENGVTPLAISDITIDFPSGGTYCNSGCSANTLGNNATYISQLNAQAGCPLFQYADPIPAGGIIVVFTGLTPSYVFDYSTQCPSATTYYAIFCNNTSTTGRFANSGTGTRTLDITFGANSDQVTYDLSSTLGDGTFVDFDTDGNDTYRQETNCIYPLAVELDYFDGSDGPEGILLSWRTLSENNADYFSIEHADYTAGFTELDRISCAGNSNVPVDYSFRDRAPAIGINYYRLKQFDYDGAFFYSPIIAFNHETEDFGVHYLPEQQQLSFSKTLKPGTRIALYQANGQLVHTIGITQKQVSVPQMLSPGMWMIRTQETNGDTHFSRFVVY